MSNQVIIIIANLFYIIIIFLAWRIKHTNFKHELKLYTERRNNDQYGKVFDKRDSVFAYSKFILSIIIIITLITIIVNGHVFNDRFPISFYVQFSFQIIILILFLLPDSTLIRYFITYLSLSFMFFLNINGLFIKHVDKRDSFDITIKELKSLAIDVENLNEEFSSRIITIKQSFDDALSNIEEKKQILSKIDSILISKNKKIENLDKIISLNEQEVEVFLNHLNIHKPTNFEKFMNIISGIFIGVIGSYLSRFLPIKLFFKTKN